MTWQCLGAAGSLYRLSNGQDMALSIPGCLDPNLDLPYSPASSFPQESADPREVVTPRSSQTVCLCSDRSSEAHDDSLSWQSSSSGLHTCASPTHRQTAKQMHEAESSRLVDGTLAGSSSSSASSVSSSSSNSSSVCTRVPEKKVDCPLNAHFMAMAAKLIYEAPEIVADCLQYRFAQCACFSHSHTRT